MKTLNTMIAIWCVLLTAVLGTNGSAAAEGECTIFPVPKEYTVKGAAPVAMARRVAVVIGEKAAEPEKFAASRLTYVLKKRFKIDVPVMTDKTPVEDTDSLLVLGTLENNALLKSLKEKHAVKLDALQGKDPMQDAFAIEVLKDGGQQVVLMIGATSRSTIYAQYAFLEAVTREGKGAVYPEMSVRDWSSLRYRDWWTTDVSYYDDTDALDQVTYARANMTQLRSFSTAFAGGAANRDEVPDAVIREFWKRGMKPYGMVNGAIGADGHQREVDAAVEWLKQGCYGIYITFDDLGMGKDPEGLCNKITAVIKEHFGEVGDRIAFVASCPDYFWLNSGNNRRIRGFRDCADGIFYFTGPPDGAFIPRQFFDQAREAGIKNHIWWHNFPCGARGFYSPVPKPRYYALLPFNRNCWGRFTFDDLREGGECMTGMSAQNEGFELAALQLFWAWDPANYTYEKARTAIYRQRHGAAAVEAVRKLDDNMYALTDHFLAMWRKWAVTAWLLKDVSKRDEVLALIDEMQEQFEAIKAGKSVSYLPDDSYDDHYIEPLEAHLEAARRLALTDFPDYLVVEKEGFNPKGGADLLYSHAADTLRTKMIGLIQLGKREEAEVYLADLGKDALPMLDAIEKKLKDLWYTEEYVNGWRGMLTPAHWEPIAAEDFGKSLALRVGRDAEGKMVMETALPNVEILFTIDGPAPAVGDAEVYNGPREFSGSCVIRAVGIQKDSGMRSDVVEHLLGYPKTNWKIAFVDSEGGRGNMAANLIDENPATLWMTAQEEQKPPHPHEVQIDLGGETVIQGIGLYPHLGIRAGTPLDYEVYVSDDGKEWGEPVAAGKFEKIEKCMTIGLREKVDARFIRLVCLSDFWSTYFSSIGELDVYDFAP